MRLPPGPPRGARPGSRQPDAAGLRRAIVKRPRVLIIGAGFAGFHCARQLERKLEAHEAEVALVTPRNYLIYSPLLPQVAAGLLSPMAVAIPLRRTMHRTHLVPGAAIGLDLDARACVVRTIGCFVHARHSSQPSRCLRSRKPSSCRKRAQNNSTNCSPLRSRALRTSVKRLR